MVQRIPIIGSMSAITGQLEILLIPQFIPKEPLDRPAQLRLQTLMGCALEYMYCFKTISNNKGLALFKTW